MKTKDTVFVRRNAYCQGTGQLKPQTVRQLYRTGGLLILLGVLNQFVFRDGQEALSIVLMVGGVALIAAAFVRSRSGY